MFRYLLFLFLYTSVFSHDDFFMITVPKSGTHLFAAYLNMMLKTEKTFLGITQIVEGEEVQEDAKDWLEKSKEKNSYFVCHFAFSKPLFAYREEHPHYKMIFCIRDLRDIIVSGVDYLDKYKNLAEKDEDWNGATYEEKLLKLLDENSRNYLNLPAQIRLALKSIEKYGEAFICRYEDFVGASGGGDIELQQEKIMELADFLSVKISEKKMNFMIDRAYGKQLRYNTTFNVGKIGRWREQFTPAVIEKFKQVLGEELVLLGYEEDYNW